MISVIAPHCRPWFAQNLLSNWKRQKTASRLIVIENGDAIGTFPSVDGVTVIASEPHQATATNTGLAWLRTEGGGGPWARFDDDDYYGPEYLSETVSCLSLADATGKPWSFVMFDDGLWRFSVGRNSQRATFGLTGGTLAATSPFVPDFPKTISDDLDWCRLMRDRGASLWSSSAWNYCYDRRKIAGTRVLSGPQTIIRRSFGDADYYGRMPLSSVDDNTIQPLRHISSPSDDEVFAALLGEN